jgi:hypothetical protein
MATSALIRSASRGANSTSRRRAGDRNVACGHDANARPIPVEPALSTLTGIAVQSWSATGNTRNNVPAG